LSRRAMLSYVRPSSPHQETDNEKSRRSRYTMPERLEELSRPEVEAVNNDRGRSVATRCLVGENTRHVCQEISKSLFNRVRCSVIYLGDASHVNRPSLVEVRALLDETACPREVENRRHLSGVKGGVDASMSFVQWDRATAAVRVAARSSAVGESSSPKPSGSHSGNGENAARVSDAPGRDNAERGGES
jgi:hypothetical protein